jgi:hypothetical protein
MHNTVKVVYYIDHRLDRHIKLKQVKIRNKGVMRIFDTDIAHEDKETQRAFETMSVKERRVKKAKQVIASSNALLRFTETLPHHAYHKINGKINRKNYLSTTLATTDLAGINYYRQRRPALYSGKRNTRAKKIAMLFDFKEQHIQPSKTGYCFPHGFYAKTDYNFSRKKNKPKSRDTHFFPSAHYPSQTSDKSILHHRFKLTKEFTQLRKKIEDISPNFNYHTVSTKTSITDLRRINQALSKLRQNGDNETRLEFNEIFFLPTSTPIGICVTDEGDANDRIIAFLSAHALELESNIQLPVICHSSSEKTSSDIKEYTAIDFFNDIRSNQVSYHKLAKDIANFKENTYSSVIKLLTREYQRLHLTPITNDNPQQEDHEREKFHHLICMLIIKLKPNFDISSYIIRVNNKHCTTLCQTLLRNDFPNHSKASIKNQIGKRNNQAIIESLNEKQIKSIIESGSLLHHTNNASRDLLLKYQHIVSKQEQTGTHCESLLTLIEKKKSCLPFFSSQPYWKRSLIKMINNNDNESIRTILIDRIQSDHVFSNEDQAVIMRFFGLDSHTISFDLFKPAVLSQQLESHHSRKYSQNP